MHLSVLGPLEIVGPDGIAPLGGPKERVVVALLGLRPNEVVSTADLIDGLWGTHPPPTALKTVQGNVARVRRSLESVGLADALVTREPGYVLRVEPEQIDAVRFERHAHAGSAALAQGDAEGAERELTAGLALWSGDALADCREASDAITAQAVRLDELRLSAIEDRTDAQLALGRHAAIVGELEALLARHPLRERLWHSLMLALYRSRRQAEALRAYQRARHALVDDLGVEPGSDLRDLEAAILRGDPSLDLVAAVGRPPGAVRLAAETSSERLLNWAATGPTFVGRDTELAALARLWRRVSDGDGPIVMISGEPGIGKTRLAAEMCTVARADGARVLYGRCDEDLGVPYQPFVEALRAYLEVCTDAELGAGLGRYSGELVRLVPELAARVDGLLPPLRSDPATEQYRLFEAVVEWLGAAGGQAPCAVVLDDVHWAAPPTVLLLRHVIRSAPLGRVMILATYRQSEVGTEHPLAEMLADLRISVPEPLLERLALDGLDASAVASFVRAASGHDLGDAGHEFVDRVHRETGGNPFFVGEIVHNVMEASADAPDSTEGAATTQLWPTDVRIPPAARDVVLRRVARLSEDAQHVLTLAAVAGMQFDVDILEQLVDVDLDALTCALEEANRARLINEAGANRCSFAHAIARGALYDRLGTSRRARIHGRVADAIERVHAADIEGYVAELAFHCAEADSDRAVGYAVAAAADALDRLAFEDAIAICARGVTAVEARRASGAPVEAREECDLLLTLGRAELRAGLPAGRATLLRAFALARTLGDVPRQAAAVLAVNRGFFSRIGRIDTELVAAIEHTIEAQGPADSPERAQLLATLASELVWAPDARRFVLSDDALATARRVGDDRTLARVLLLRSMTISAPDTREERAAVLHELRLLAEELGDPAIRFDAAFASSGTAWECGDFTGMNAMEEVATALAAELRQPRLEWQASFMRAARRLYEGELERAERTAEQTLELGRRAGQDGEAFIFYNEQLLEIRRWQGRLDELEAVLVPLAGNEAFDFGFALTRYAYDAGEVDLVRRVYTEKIQPLALPPRRDMLALGTMHTVAYLAARFGDAPTGERVYRALAPHASVFTSTTVAKPVGAHHLGMLAAMLDEAELAAEHFRAATLAHERAGAPLLLAETHLEHARFLAGCERPLADHRPLLDLVRAIAEPRGAWFLLRGCDDVGRGRPA